jgi:hypothetical protein
MLTIEGSRGLGVEVKLGAVRSHTERPGDRNLAPLDAPDIAQCSTRVRRAFRSSL